MFSSRIEVPLSEEMFRRKKGREPGTSLFFRPGSHTESCGFSPRRRSAHTRGFGLFLNFMVISQSSHIAIQQCGYFEFFLGVFSRSVRQVKVSQVAPPEASRLTMKESGVQPSLNLGRDGNVAAHEQQLLFLATTEGGFPST